MKFSEFLTLKRKEKRIPIRKFAEQINISPSFLCDLERGTRNFPLNSKKNPNLFNDMVKALSLNEKDKLEMSNLIEESQISNQTLSQELSAYLLSTPSAQQALRKAKDKNTSNETWKKIISVIDNDKKWA